MAVIRHNCKATGVCYLDVYHPPIHAFDRCFGGKIEMSDIDGVVERNGYFLFMEWKKPPGNLSTGQRIMLEKLSSKAGVTCIVVSGPVHPSANTSLRVQCFKAGRLQPESKSVTLDGLRELFAQWYDNVNRK